MPTFSDYALLGIADFMNRMGGGQGVNASALLDNRAAQRAEDEFAAEGGTVEFTEGPNIPAMVGVSSEVGDSPMPLQQNVPTMVARQRAAFESQKILGQKYIEQGLVTKGLGLIQAAEESQAKIQQAQAAALKAKADQEKKQVDTVLNVTKIFGPQGAQNIADQLGINIEVSNEKALVGEIFKINGMPYAAIRSKKGFEVIEPKMSGAGIMLTGIQAGKFGPNMVKTAWEHHTGLTNLNSLEGQEKATNAMLKDWEMTKEPSAFEKKIKLEEHAMKLQNYRSLIATRAARLAEYKRKGTEVGTKAEGKQLTEELKKERLIKLRRDNARASKLVDRLPLTERQKAELRILESQAKSLENQKTKAMAGKDDLSTAIMKGLKLPGAGLSKEEQIEVYDERLEEVYKKMDAVTNEATPLIEEEPPKGSTTPSVPAPTGRKGDDIKDVENPFRVD